LAILFFMLFGIEVYLTGCVYVWMLILVKIAYIIDIEAVVL
jgi:hypothetical protein